jgi:hypothetical protein
MNIIATGTFSKEDGTLMIDLEFHPATPIEHEIVAEFVRHPTRTLIFPTKLVADRTDPKNVVMKRVPTDEIESDLLHVRLELDDDNAFDQAVHNLENRRRASEGLPSLEQQAQQVAAAQKAQLDAEAASKAASEQAAKDLDASRERIENAAAKMIADRVAPPPAPAPAPAQLPAAPEPSKDEPKPQAKEPDKVQ